MSEINAMIRHMRAKGIDCHVILEAVEALSEAKNEAIEERRAADRVRKARQRMAQRQALKTQELSHVTPAESADSPDTKTSPPVSPLFPSPKPLTNNPPLSPPTSQISEAREPKSKRAKATRLPADWVLPSEFADWARSYRDPAFPEIQLTDEEIAREGHSIADWSANSANGAKADWFAAWRNWIRRAAPTILRARPRADRAPARAGARVETRFAPKISQHDAFALAAAEASFPERGAGWEPDHGHGPRSPSGPPRLEVIDSGDARGADATRAGGNRSSGSQTVLPLPFAAVR